MPACTFFGHRDCPETVRPKLRSSLKDLITEHNVDMFYVGSQGHFDALVRAELRKLQKEYPHIHYAVVLAYMPQQGAEGCSDTMLPEGIESVHPRYAISWRNNWMLQQSDYVVVYVTHPWGGAARYLQKAQKSKKYIYNLHYSANINHEDIATS